MCPNKKFQDVGRVDKETPSISWQGEGASGNEMEIIKKEQKIEADNIGKERQPFKGSLSHGEEKVSSVFL